MMNHRAAQIAGACVLAGLALTGCKKNSIDSSSTTTNESVIGPKGGKLQGADGQELRIPGGALSEDIEFKLKIAEPADGYPPNGDYTFSGKVFSFEPHGEQFLSPATVVIPFRTEPKEAVLLTAEPGDGAWFELPITGKHSTSYDTAVSQLSFFVVADKAAGPSWAAHRACPARGARRPLANLKQPCPTSRAMSPATTAAASPRPASSAAS